MRDQKTGYLKCKEDNMDTIKALIERVKENDLVATRFHKVERRILSVLNFKDFFEILLTELVSTFSMPYVWISVVEGSELEEAMANSSDDSWILADRHSIVSDSLFKGLIGNQAKPLLINSDLKPYYQLFPAGKAYVIKSLAIAPITLDGVVVGSLNQGDADSTRFEPGKDTGLLEQLAIKISLCLSNVTAHERLKFLAFHDPLTELLNRRVMESVLKREFMRSRRYESILSLIFIDLDDFKKVNDTYGHDAGDEMLKYVADKLVDLTRETDIVSRFAGDEFVIILPETGVVKAKNLIQRVQQYFDDNPMHYKDKLIPVSISFGASSTQDNEVCDSDNLLKIADQKLYIVKSERKETESVN